MMKKIVVLFLCITILCGCQTSVEDNHTKDHALQRAEEYAHAINYDYETPDKIYVFLAQGIKNQMTEDEFCQAFEKERSYPYITPLYLFDPEVTMTEDMESADVVYKQAARIIGMEYDIRLVYENGDYYVEDWYQFIDKSYLDKFIDTPYSLDWYYDLDD